MKSLFSFAVLAIGLMACQQTPIQKLDNPARALGIVEISFDTKAKTSSARLVTNRTLLPDQNTIAFASNTFSVTSNGSLKYLSAKFDVANISSAALQDLTLVAYHQASNQADTAIKGLQNFGGLSSPQLDAYAQAAKPGNSVNGFSPFTVNDAGSDFQAFQESEVSIMETQANSLLNIGEYLFPYGFVARASNTSRNLSVSANAGVITIGLTVPNTNEPSSSVERFKMTFIAFTQPLTSRVTESLEERLGTSSAVTRATGFGVTAANIAQITAESVSSGILLNGVRTAGNSTDVKHVLGDRSWQAGVSNDDEAQGIATDSSGNVYITGYTQGALSGSNLGGYDAFLIKYNSSGVQQWVTQFGTAAEDQAWDLALDSSNNIYVVGYTLGALTGSSFGNRDGFLIKFNSSGVQQFVKQIGTPGYDHAYDVAVNPTTDDVYVTGIIAEGYALAGFGGAVGTVSGYVDMFLQKYNSSGIQQWVQQYGSSTATTPHDDYAYGLAVDSSGNASIGGGTTGSFTGFTNQGSFDAFTTKFDTNGTRQWTQQKGSAGDEYVSDVAIDSSGNVVVAGDTSRNLDGVTNSSSEDTFVIKYNASGVQQWLTQSGSNNIYDGAFGLKLDSSDNIYVTGYYSVTAENVFLSKYNSSGVRQWFQQIGSNGADYGYGVTLDPSGNIWVTGYTDGSLGGFTNAGATSPNYNGDILLLRFDALANH